MKYLLNILFYISGCILLVHNVIPHFHHDELKEDQHYNEHNEAESLVDWLFLSFHNDLGEGHLEYFSEYEEANFDSPSFVQVLTGLKNYTSQVQLSAFTYVLEPATVALKLLSEKLYTSFYFFLFPSRGPPFIF